jgi:NADH-quinone oxidoreductase subunit J
MTPLAVTGLANASAWAVYAVGTALAAAGALGVVLLRNPVHCALSLVTTLFGVALLFIDQGADFLAAVQVIVYAGAIVILFLFVIMLLGVDRKEAFGSEKLRSMTPIGIVVGLAVVIELLILSRSTYWATGAKSTSGPTSGPGENVQKLGQTIFTRYLLPFEMTSALLVIAVVAAVVLVRRVSGPGPARRHPTPRETVPERAPTLPAGAPPGEGTAGGPPATEVQVAADGPATEGRPAAEAQL